MANLKNIKNEIINKIKEINKNISEEFFYKINLELDEMEIVEGINGKSNLENFYEIWKNNTNKIGHENKINSWTAYYLKMTKKKPDENSIFMPERRVFARAGFPDIDSDFDYEHRDEIYKYIINKYGRDKVGNVGTHGLLKFKSCVTRLAKVMDFANSFEKGSKKYITDNDEKVREILSPFPKKGILKIKGDDGEVHFIKNFKDAYKYCEDFRFYIDKYGGEEFKEYISRIENGFINFSYHASGICISDIPVNEISPLRTAKEGILATQFPYEDLELLGLIKFDILAIKTLSVISKTIKKVKENWGIDIDIENLPLEDDRAFKLYRDGNLGGIFQAEEFGMQKTLMEMGVDKMGDIIAGIALYRPGPMDAIPEYCARKKGTKKIDYYHPSIEKYVKPYLGDTYGILCIHEDTLISLSDGTHKFIKNIKEKDRVCSYNEEKQKIESKEVMGCALTRRSDGYKITLNNGFSVILTEDHKIYTWDGMKQVKDLNIDKDIVACPNSLLSYSKKDFFPNIGIDEKIAYLCGFAIGDGYIKCNFVLCLGDEKDSIKMEQWVNDNIPSVKTKRYFNTRCWYISCAGKELVKNWEKKKVGNRKTEFGMFIDQVGLRKGCREKRIPSFVFLAKEETKLSLMAGLMDSDGCIFNDEKNKRISVTYTSINHLLLEDIRHLCQLLDINISISGYKILFNQPFYFLEKIRPYLVLKNNKDKYETNWFKRNVFYSKSFIETKRKKLGLSVRGFTEKYSIARSNYSTTKKDFISILTIPNFISEFGNYKNGLYFYRIKYIEKVYDMQFYGMSVKDNHNLIGNGILISNCFQESVMQICESLAGFSTSDGYVMIKAIGKKKSYLMDKFEKQFISGCVKNKVPEKIAKEYWDKFIVPFSSYGFNKSHAASYGLVSYQTAYLKAHYPEEFVCSLLDVTLRSKSGTKYEKVEKYEKEFSHYNKLNFKFLPRSINLSKTEYIIEERKSVKNKIAKSSIRPSLLCKGLSYESAVEIEKNQPYNNIYDLAQKTKSDVVDLRCVESLYEHGYLNCFYKKGDKPSLEKVKEQFRNAKEDIKIMEKKGLESIDLFE